MMSPRWCFRCFSSFLDYITYNKAIYPDRLDPDSLDPDRLDPDGPDPDGLDPDADSLDPDGLDPDRLDPDSLNRDSLDPDGPSLLSPESLRIAVEPQARRTRTSALVRACQSDPARPYALSGAHLV